MRFGGNFEIFRLAFSGVRLDFDGRRPLIRPSFPVWSRPELVNVGFGPIFFSAAKAPGRMVFDDGGQKPYGFLRLLAIDGQKPCGFLWRLAIGGQNPYEFLCLLTITIIPYIDVHRCAFFAFFLLF